MKWNWELPSWPKFHYDHDWMAQKERQFLLSVGSASVYLKTLEEEEYYRFIKER